MACVIGYIKPSKNEKKSLSSLLLECGAYEQFISNFDIKKASKINDGIVWAESSMFGMIKFAFDIWDTEEGLSFWKKVTGTMNGQMDWCTHYNDMLWLLYKADNEKISWKNNVDIDSRVNEAIEGWIAEELEEIRIYNYSYEHKQSLIADFSETLRLQVKFILAKDLKADVSYSKNYYALFINNSSKRTRAIFKLLTGLNPGATSKGSKDIFVFYFGTYLAELETIEKNRELQKIEDEKQEKTNLEKVYFSDSIWDNQKIFNLTPLQRGRIKKSLDKLFRFNGVNKSLKEGLETAGITSKHLTNNMYKWNRKKSNNMGKDEEKDYKAKLIAGRSFYGGGYSIPKIVFDILNLEDTTNTKQLES